MPNNKRHTIKQLQGKGKDKVHPGSRKANQLDRISLRTEKLVHSGRQRKITRVTKLERPLFFIAHVNSVTPLTLDQFKSLIAGSYLTRNNEEFAAELAARRPGRPKQARLVALEAQIAQETAEYASGLAVPDLTDERTCRLIWHWREHGTRVTKTHVELLRIVRVTPDSTEVVLAKEGKDTLLSVNIGRDGVEDVAEGEEMQVE
ncbi:hypothetical protein QFC24_001633 [Naganishia onofrii]|uniref:Uncharacterized protein n=1 Tax=Naganishia onofrii TaxID=1851511 RepID=A0ACC2XT16_9TREE|nr:hypothetical protein QFC24_001633 [Naganishia onofrii]